MFKSVLMPWLTVYLVFTCISASAASMDQSSLGQYEVRVYSHRDYVGDSRSYVLNTRSHRIVMINQFPQNLDNAVSSIHVGSEVYAILFDFHDFHISLGAKRSSNWFTGLVNALVEVHKKMTPLGYIGGKKTAQGPSLVSGELFGQINVGVYTESTPMVMHNDVYTSMLIIPKSLDYAYGVALYNIGDHFIRVEPIPDEIRFKERRIPDFGPYLNKKISHVAFLGPRIQNTHLTLYDETNYKGKAISLPGVASDKITFSLADYEFAAKTQSIRLGVTPIKIDSVRVAAPPAEAATVQEIITVLPIPVMTLMAEAAPVKDQSDSPKPPPPERKSRQDEPDLPSGWGQTASPLPPDEPPRPRHEEEPEPPREPARPSGWEPRPPDSHRNNLPPGIADIRGRWQDNHGNFFEIIQHGFDFILIGDGVPVHGAGIQHENGRISLIVKTGEGEVLHLEGRIEQEAEHEPARRIELDNRIVLSRGR